MSRGKALPVSYSWNTAISICPDSSHSSHLQGTCIISRDAYSWATSKNSSLFNCLSLHTLSLSITQPLQLNLTINTGYKRLNKITIKFGTELKPTKHIVVNYNFTNSTLQSPRLAVLWQNSKIDFRLKMWVKNSYQNSFTPNSRNCEGLEPNGQVFLKTITQDDHCKQKSWNTYGTSTMWSSNND